MTVQEKKRERNGLLFRYQATKCFVIWNRNVKAHPVSMAVIAMATTVSKMLGPSSFCTDCSNYCLIHLMGFFNDVFKTL